MMAEADAVCAGCGREIAGGAEACNETFQTLTGRSFTDTRFGVVHNLVVDTYALQHPDRYCVSAKSLAAHLCSLCNAIERNGATAMPNEALRRFLDGRFPYAKPDLPFPRGALTIGDVAEIDDPTAYSAAVRRWSEAVWAAYAPLHAIANAWLDEAFSGRHASR